MLANPPADPMARSGHISIAWPTEELADKEGKPVGFLMPHIQNSRQLVSVYNHRRRLKVVPAFNWKYLHVTALNLAWIVQALHEKGYVLGDIKAENILVNDQALVAIIDTDSFQVRDPKTNRIFRCTVASEGFTPPELIGRDIDGTDQSVYQDRFRLAVAIHLLLFGEHPFSGKWQGPGEQPEQSDLIRRGLWYGSRDNLVVPVERAIPLGVTHRDLQQLFRQCFNEGHNKPDIRPSAAAWHRGIEAAMAGLVTCGVNGNHVFYASLGQCHWCTRAAQLGVDVFPPQPDSVRAIGSGPRTTAAPSPQVSVNGTSSPSVSNFSGSPPPSTAGLPYPKTSRKVSKGWAFALFVIMSVFGGLLAVALNDSYESIPVDIATPTPRSTSNMNASEPVEVQGDSTPRPSITTGSTCWFQMQPGAKRLEGYRCNVISRKNANGHNVYDVIEPGGLTRTVVLWNDDTAEVLLNGKRYEGRWQRDDEDNIYVDAAGGVFAFPNQPEHAINAATPDP